MVVLSEFHNSSNLRNAPKRGNQLRQQYTYKKQMILFTYIQNTNTTTKRSASTQPSTRNIMVMIVSNSSNFIAFQVFIE